MRLASPGDVNVLVSGTEMETLSESGVASGINLVAGLVIARGERRASIARKVECISVKGLTK